HVPYSALCRHVRQLEHISRYSKHMVSRRDDDPQADSPPGPPEEPSAVLSPSQQIAAALKRERLRAGLSLSEVPRRAGIGKSTMSGLETGTGNPSLETMWALAA